MPDNITGDQLQLYGVTSDQDITTGVVSAGANCLSGALTGHDGDTNFTAAAIPSVSLSQNHCTVQRYVLHFGTDAVVGNTYDFTLANQDGTAFATPTPAVGARITIISPRATGF